MTGRGAPLGADDGDCPLYFLWVCLQGGFNLELWGVTSSGLPVVDVLKAGLSLPMGASQDEFGFVLPGQGGLAGRLTCLAKRIATRQGARLGLGKELEGSL